MAMATRIFIMNESKMQQAGPPLEVNKNSSNQFVAGFIGFPAMNSFKNKLLKKIQIILLMLKVSS
jgi:ABC-type sugar transport system ATPase subunit